MLSRFFQTQRLSVSALMRLWLKGRQRLPCWGERRPWRQRQGGKLDAPNARRVMVLRQCTPAPPPLCSRCWEGGVEGGGCRRGRGSRCTAVMKNGAPQALHPRPLFLRLLSKGRGKDSASGSFSGASGWGSALRAGAPGVGRGQLAAAAAAAAAPCKHRTWGCQGVMRGRRH